MALKILTNQAGYYATSLVEPSGTTSTGYDKRDFVSGPRSALYRMDASGGDNSVGYVFGEEHTMSYLVISRADLLLTADTLDLSLRHRNSGGTWADNQTYAPFDETLIGPTSQDFVDSFTSAAGNRYGYGLEANSGGTEAFMFSKLYFCEAFSFGVEPTTPLVEEELIQGDTLFAPPRGDEPFATEKRIALTFKNVTRSKVDEFLLLPNIFSWPFFLYDDDDANVALWEHRLEHVVLESFTELWQQRSDLDYWDLNLLVRRLKHYE